MKAFTRILILILGGALINLANAQDKIGIRVGAGVSDLSTSGLGVLNEVIPNPQGLVGFTAGVFAEWQLNEKFSFAPELNYSQKGFQYRETFNVDVFDLPIPIGGAIQTRLQYIDAPLLFKYQLADGRIKPYVTAGPSFGYATAGNLVAKANVIFDVTVAKIPIPLKDKLYNQFDFGGVIGGGVAIETGQGTLGIDMRYNHSFTNLLQIPLVTNNLRNKGLGVGVSYAVNLNKTYSPRA